MGGVPSVRAISLDQIILHTQDKPCFGRCSIGLLVGSAKFDIFKLLGLIQKYAD